MEKWNKLLIGRKCGVFYSLLLEKEKSTKNCQIIDWNIWAKAKLLQLKLIHIFSRAILLLKKSENEKNKPTFIVLVLKVKYYLGGLSFFDLQSTKRSNLGSIDADGFKILTETENIAMLFWKWVLIYYTNSFIHYTFLKKAKLLKSLPWNYLQNFQEKQLKIYINITPLIFKCLIMIIGLIMILEYMINILFFCQ